MTHTRKLAIAGAALVSWLAMPGAAWASHCPPGQVYPADCVHGTEVTRELLNQLHQVLDNELLAESVSESVSESESSVTLPVTGGDLLGLTAIGLGALGAGTVFVRRSRRTT